MGHMAAFSSLLYFKVGIIWVLVSPVSNLLPAWFSWPSQWNLLTTLVVMFPLRVKGSAALWIDYCTCSRF